MEASTRRGRREERWLARAEKVRDAFGLVLILVLVTYVLASVFKDNGWTGVLITLSTTATSIVALTSSHARPKLVRRAMLVAAISVLLSLVSAAFGGRLGLNIASFLVIGLLGVAMAAVLQRVLTSGSVSSRTILGAISVYTSLGLLFTWAYALIDRLEGGGFFGETVKTQTGDFLFFSYTTLTTTGYGDLVPAGQVGRMLSGFEMMLGQIFLVTLVAGLVSLWRPGEGLLKRRQRRAENSPDAT
jgi:Ion channel